MKTIWDAVNELNGELTAAVYANLHKENYKKTDVFLHKIITNRVDPNPVGSYVIYSCDESDRGDVELICTTREFNALAAEMSLGLDINPINEGYYHKYLDADKQELEPIKQDLIYTQEMHDNGERPSAGMECILKAHNEIFAAIGTVEYINEIGLLFRYKENNLCDFIEFDSESLFKPITPPTPLIDGEAYQFDYNTGSVGMNNVAMRYNKHIKAFQFGNYTFKPEHCTNIKPLTVKGE